jgi:hypothetical protein
VTKPRRVAQRTILYYTVDATLGRRSEALLPNNKWSLYLVFAWAVTLAWAAGALPVAALSPQVTPGPPVSPLGQTLPSLRAVLLVGPMDKDDGSDASTKRQARNMDLAASELTADGVAVTKFYAPNCDWEQIKTAVNGANFLLYRGHGVYSPPPGLPSPAVGGFYLSKRDSRGIARSYEKGPDDVRNDLKPAPNAVVMLGSACFSAGMAAVDKTAIGSKEAQRRVAMYSDPFLDLGAAGYFANWYDKSLQMFVHYLFLGKTLGQAYQSFYYYKASSAEQYVHPRHPADVMWLDKDNFSGLVQYNNAFVGQPDKTLAELFPHPR